MNQLHEHIQAQQEIACRIEGLLDALLLLIGDGKSPEGQYAIAATAWGLSRDLYRNLDSVNLSGLGVAQ